MGHTKKNGMGDITLLANYKLFDSKLLKNPSRTTTQQLWIGGGFKIPSGAFNVDANGSTTTLTDINAQIGTGSVDFLLNARHSIQYKNVGISTAASYKIGMANSQRYKYGNRLTLNSIAFYQLKTSSITIIPNAGFSFENIEGNRLNQQKIYLIDGLDAGWFATGGHAFNFLAGVEVSI